MRSMGHYMYTNSSYGILVFALPDVRGPPTSAMSFNKCGGGKKLPQLSNRRITHSAAVQIRCGGKPALLEAEAEPLIITATPPEHATTLDHTQAMLPTRCHSHHVVALQRPHKLGV